MNKPVEPKPEDCCNSGCNPCIFDIYEKQLKAYNKYLKCGESEYYENNEVNGISQLQYTNFIVVKNESICQSHNLITFKREQLNGKKIWWRPGDHFLFKYTATKSPCTRAYTPLERKNGQRDCDFFIIVKKYENGLISRYLCDLHEGDLTLWRGPYGQYKLEPNKFKRIVLIAQGTGIAPFITIIEHILHNEDDMTRVLLLYCCKNVNVILFRNELYDFKSYWNFRYEVFLSASSPNIQYKYQEPIRNHKLNIDYITDNFKPFSTTEQFVLCGSSKFNEAFYDNIKTTIPEIDNIVIL